MRRRILDLLGAALIAGTLIWLVVLARASGDGGDLHVRSWLPTATVGR